MPSHTGSETTNANVRGSPTGQKGNDGKVGSLQAEDLSKLLGHQRNANESDNSASQAREQGAGNRPPCVLQVGTDAGAAEPASALPPMKCSVPAVQQLP